ncbi:HPP family protein [Brevundimonas sp.]|uniref:HPP family protein n=1 Tax=Brevundimonas sp. TaxID=1871086 RepID=UPI003F71A58D
MKIFRPILAGATLRDRAVACLGALLGIGLTALISRALLGGETALPLMMTASMGASAVLIFAVPASPLAQPWSVVGGHMVSALTGITISRLIPDPMLASGVAVAAAIALMSLLRCLHPPGGSTALIGVLGGTTIHGAGLMLAFVPIGLNAALLAAMGFLFHRFLSGHAWPHRAAAVAIPAGPQVVEADIDAALTAFGEPLDVSRDDLQTIVKLALENAAARKP